MRLHSDQTMTSADPPERHRLYGAREQFDAPPIHAVEDGDDTTLCGLEVDGSLAVVGTREPFMSASAVVEMLEAQVPPCETCRRLARAAADSTDDH